MVKMADVLFSIFYLKKLHAFIYFLKVHRERTIQNGVLPNIGGPGGLL